MATDTEQQPNRQGPIQQILRAGREAMRPASPDSRVILPQNQNSNTPDSRGTLNISGHLFRHPDVQRMYDEMMINAPDGIIGDEQQALIVNDLAHRTLTSGKVSPEEAKVLQEMMRGCDSVRRNLREGGGDRFSSIYLSPREMGEITDNPALWFEKKLRQLELYADDPDSILFKAQAQRIELAAQFFGSQSFDESRVLLEPRVLFDPRISQESRESFQRLVDGYASDPRKSRLSSYIGARIDGVYVQAKLSRATMGDLPKVTEQIRNMGDRGLNMLEACDGGMVGEWRGRYERILKDMSKNHRLLPSDFDRAADIAVEQLLKEKAHYQPRVQEFFRRWQADGSTPNIELNEDYAKGVIARARIAWRIRMRQSVVMAAGKGPGQGDIPSYATINLEEGMLAVSRFRDWFIRKWGKKVALPVWNVGARFTAGLNPELKKLIGDTSQALWTDATQSTDPTRKTAALKKIQWLIDENTVDGFSVHEGQDFEQTVLKKMHKLGKRGLKDIVTIEEGGERMQYFLRPYFYLDSDWRRKLIETYVSSAYTHADQYCLGSELKKTGGAFFFDPTKREGQPRALAGQAFEKTLQKVAVYRPQALAEFLYDGENRSFATWFSEHSSELGYANANDMFSDVNRRFIMLNNRLMMNNLPAIDYSQIDSYIEIASLPSEQQLARIEGLSAGQKEQWKHVQDVFSIFEEGTDRSPLDNPEKYFKTMKALHGHLTQNGNSQLNELKSIKYDKFFLSLAWEDDIPTEFLEDPSGFVSHINRAYFEKIGVLKPGEEIPEFSLTDPSKNDAKANEFINKLISAAGISEQYTQLGVGPGSPLSRAWGDYALAGDAFSAMLENGFGPDEKEFLKMIKTVWTKVEMYQGAPVATDAAIKLGAAWIGSAQVKAQYGDFMTELADSSVLKEVWGNNAPSLSLDNTAEARENLEKIVPLMDKEAPATAKALGEFLRISTVHLFGAVDTHISWHALLGWTKHLGLHPDHLIHRLERTQGLGLMDYKARMALSLLLVVLFLAAMNEAKKGGKEGTSGSGGH